MAKILEAGCPFWDPWESGLYQPLFLVFSNSDYVNYEQFLQRLSCGPTKSSIFMFFFHWTQILYLALLAINPILILRLDRD